jgi:hypothetical protein
MDNTSKITCIDNFNDFLNNPDFLKNNIYNLSKFKNNIVNLKSSFQDCDYRKIKDNYFAIYKLYEQLEQKLNKFIVDYIKFNKDTNIYELIPINNEDKSTALIQKRKNDANEIIEYEILFEIIDFYLWLSDFIYNFDTLKIDYKQYTDIKKNYIDKYPGIFYNTISNNIDTFKIATKYANIINFIYYFNIFIKDDILYKKNKLIRLSLINEYLDFIKDFTNTYTFNKDKITTNSPSQIITLNNGSNDKEFYEGENGFKHYKLLMDLSNKTKFNSNIKKYFDEIKKNFHENITKQYEEIKQQEEQEEQERTLQQNNESNISTQRDYVAAAAAADEAIYRKEYLKQQGNMQLPPEIEEVAKMGLEILQNNNTNPEEFFNQTFVLATKSVEKLTTLITEDEKNKMLGFIEDIKKVGDNLLIHKKKDDAIKTTKNVFKEIKEIVRTTTSFNTITGWTWFIRPYIVNKNIDNIQKEIISYINQINFEKIKDTAATTISNNPLLILPIPNPTSVNEQVIVIPSQELAEPAAQAAPAAAEPAAAEPAAAEAAEPAAEAAAAVQAPAEPAEPAPAQPPANPSLSGKAGGALFSNNLIDEEKFKSIKELLQKIIKLKKQVYDNIILKKILPQKQQQQQQQQQEQSNLIINNSLNNKPIAEPETFDFKIRSKTKFFKGVVDKLNNDRPISRKDLHKYENIEEKIKSLDSNEEDKEKALLYIAQVKDRLKKQKKVFKEENVIDTDKIILDFKRVADVFKMVLIGLTVISIIFYVVVLLISIYNFFNLFIKIIVSIIYLFYNTAITNNDTLSYTTKRIIKCTKDNYSDDIFNVLNEQLTALSVFNTNIYIIYILLGYIILYLLFFIYSSIFSKYYILLGNIKDIDPKFTLLTIIAIIFTCSFIHLLIYKFLFKSICISKFKEINLYEQSIDTLIKNEISKNKQDLDFSDNFYKLLTDTTKRNEIDTIFANMVSDLQEGQPNNLGEFLLIYDIYIYFEDYIYINDKKKFQIKKFFDEMIKGEIPRHSFISFLDTNERRLIKPYHEELPFYNQIPSDKLENYKAINTNISEIIVNINKSIIKYSGTFYPFLFTCIYIIVICIYNFISLYMIFKYISENKQEDLFPQFIYTMADKFVEVSNIIYNLFNK